MATIGNGTTISIGGSLVDATDISISASSTAVDTTTIGAIRTTAIQGRPTVTGSATIHMDNATALSLANKFCGATPDTASIVITINASGGATGGVDFTGDAIVTSYNPTYASDTVQSAQVSWQYTGQITATRAA
jgi:hypothetical protein